MTESGYARYLFNEPRGEITREGKEGEISYQGIFASPQMLGVPCMLRYSIVKDAHVNESKPHVHDFPMVLSFVGANDSDVFDGNTWTNAGQGGLKESGRGRPEYYRRGLDKNL